MIKKYIDAERLKAEIEKNTPDTPKLLVYRDIILALIDSLQQEQNSAQDTELTYFESALFTAFSYAWQSYLRGEEVNVAQWAKENSAELLEAARFSQEQPEVDLEEEVKRYWNNHSLEYRLGRIADIDFLYLCARHFYELGKNSK